MHRYKFTIKFKDRDLETKVLDFPNPISMGESLSLFPGTLSNTEIEVPAYPVDFEEVDDVLHDIYHGYTDISVSLLDSNLEGEDLIEFKKNYESVIERLNSMYASK